jgi:hypothetical protein
MYYFPDPEAAMNEKEATAQIACAELNKVNVGTGYSTEYRTGELAAEP